MAEVGQGLIRGRRLVACCDGTWNKPDRQGHTTNVVRLVRSIRAYTEDSISQIVCYHHGVGTGNFVDRWIGGGTGIGLSENVRSVSARAARQLPGWRRDRYSRGAYTAAAWQG
jgi:uncharacterized protein (DUF2235 family)